MDEYVGVYRFDEKTTRTITRDGDKLYSQRPGRDKAEILALEKDHFYFVESDNHLRFRRDAQGKITGADYVPRRGMEEFGKRTAEPLPGERQPKAELFPESESRFFLKVVDAQVDFKRGPDGKATGLVLHQGGRDVPAKRVR